MRKGRRAVKHLLLSVLILLTISSTNPCFAAEPASIPEQYADTPLQDVAITIDSGTFSSRTTDTDEVLINPGKGFIHYYWPDPTGLEEYFNVINVGYMRFGWNQIEPEEGTYNW